MASKERSTSKNLSSQPGVASPEQFQKLIRSSLLRIGIPVLVIWVIAILIGHPYVIAGAGVLTLVALGLGIWGYRHISKSRAVAGILRDADFATAEGRKQAMEQLESRADRKDVAALFAKAQLLMHEDPRRALEVLEQIDLKKAMGPVADEARAQRAMIHLMLGETDSARSLADGIDLSRHSELKSRAAMAAVIAEAWARTGQAKRAGETLDLFDPENEELGDIRPQLFRARAFAAVGQNDVKRMRHALRRLRSINAQLLGGFMQKKVHPLLEREAKKMLMQSGAVPKKLVRRRM